MSWVLPALAAAAAGTGLFLLIRKGIAWTADRRVENFQNDLLKKYTDEIGNSYRKMRGWRHDYHSQIQTMKAHLALNQLRELSDYLDLLDDDLKTVDTAVKSGNITLDAVLNSKLSLMESREIRVSAGAHVPPKLTVNEVDLCTIVGNLLDNAMESCAKLPKASDRFIRVYIGVLKGQLYLSVTNATGETERKRFFPSSKGPGHGFGLRRVDALAAKYGGYVNRQNEPGVFATEILLPL